jgi:hypothetical protein
MRGAQARAKREVDEPVARGTWRLLRPAGAPGRADAQRAARTADAAARARVRGVGTGPARAATPTVTACSGARASTPTMSCDASAGVPSAAATLAASGSSCSSGSTETTGPSLVAACPAGARRSAGTSGASRSSAACAGRSGLTSGAAARAPGSPAIVSPGHGPAGGRERENEPHQQDDSRAPHANHCTDVPNPWHNPGGVWYLKGRGMRSSAPA